MPFGLSTAVNAMTSAVLHGGNNNSPITPVHISHSNDETLRARFRMRGTRLSLRARAVRGWWLPPQGGAAAARQPRDPRPRSAPLCIYHPPAFRLPCPDAGVSVSDSARLGGMK